MSEHGFDFAKFFLEDEPRAALFSAASPFSTSPSRQRFFQSNDLFNTAQNQFFGQLGTQARQGQIPDLSFADFTGGLDFNQLFREQQQAFGSARNSLNPRTRWLLGF